MCPENPRDCLNGGTAVPAAPRVVVADDEESIRFTFRAFLQGAGYHVDEARDVAEAEKAFARGVDVAVIDVLLGTDSGFPLLAKLKELAPCASGIMITGLPEQETISRSLHMGAFDYLAKPVTKDRLLMAVERAVANTRLLGEKQVLEKENRLYRARLEELVRTRTRQLEESQRLMVNTVSCLREAVLLLDADTYQIMNANPAVERMFGYAQEELLGRGSDILHVNHEELTRFRALLRQGIEEHGVFRLDKYRMRRKDGSVFPTEHTVTPMTDSDGRPTAWVSVVRDMTERARVLEELEESRERFKMLSEASFSGVAVHDKGILLEANDQYFDMFGYKPEELLGTQAMELTLAPEWIKTARQRVTSTDMGPYRTMGRKRDGTQFPLDIQVREVTYKGRKARAAVMIDSSLRDATQEALTRSENSLRAVMDAMEDYVLLMDPQGKVLMYNRWVPRPLNVGGTNFLDKNIFDLLEPDVAKGRRPLFRHVVATGAPAAYCDFFQPGMVLDVLLTPIKDGLGTVVSVALFARDITEQRHARRELEKSEQLHRALFEHAGDVIWTQDTKMRYTQVSTSVERMFGWTPEEFLELPFERRCPPEARAMLAALFAEAMAQAELGQEFEPFSLVHPHYHRNGTMLRVETTMVPWWDKTGRITGLQGSFRDVTRTHQAEQSLAQAEERFRLLFEAARDMAAIIDGQGRFLDVNPALAHGTGHARGELLAMRLDQLAADPAALPADPDQLQDKSLHAALKRKDGSQFQALVRAKATHHGQAPATLVMITDLADAPADTHSESRLLAAVSHEVRTPLYGVMGMLQLLSMTPLNAEQQEYLGLAETSARGLLTVTEDMLDLSRLTSGEAALADEEFSLNALLGAATSVLGREATDQGATLHHEIGAGVPDRVTGDAARIRQVLFHLTSAALKNTPHGELHLSVALADPDTTPRSRAVPLVFRLSGAASPPSGDEHLLVSLAGGFVQRLGGELHVRDNELSFSVTLGRTKSDQRGGEAARAAMSGSPLRVLVAEDNPVNRLLVSRLLTRMGHSVRAVENGLQALDALNEEAFDCVLMDIMMPVMNGLEALEHIRAGNAGDNAATLPIIALTAQAMKGDRERILEAGMDAYLAKPVEMESLARALEQTVAGGEGETF